MKSSAKYFAAVLCLFLPSVGRAQSAGQVACARGDGYVYLYSDMTTLEVRTTLQCGEQVQITGRFDKYVGVRTAKGDVGFLPLSSLVFLKDKPGPVAPPPATARPARPRTAYDPSEHPEAAAKPRPDPSELILPNGTPLHLKLSKAISSATAHVGELVELEVLEEVTVDDLMVIPKGAAATGLVTEAEPKKHLGHGGKLGFLVYSVRLSDNEKAPARSFQEGSGASNSAGAVIPLASGKDVVFPAGMECTAYVDGDMHLKREAFQATKDNANQAPTAAAQTPTQPRQ